MRRYFLAGALRVIIAHLDALNVPEYIIEILNETASLLENKDDLSGTGEEST